jgi:glycosyltransferase involved in cell wall biosynthesis/ribosomal protein S18 acetylase RimI-like enzyme
MTVRIAHVTTTDISLALLLGPQLTAFRDAGYEVFGISAPGPFVAQLEDSGIAHVPLRYATRKFAPQNDVRALRELVSVFNSLRPTIVHTHNPKPGIYGRMAARAAGVPHIVNTVHGLYALPEDGLAKRGIVYGLERLAAACSHAELVQNVEDVAVLKRLGLHADKLFLLGNGIDLQRFSRTRIEVARRKELRKEWGISDDAVVCGTVGRLVWEKGYRELFEAAALLAQRRPELHFVIIGPSDDDKADGISAADCRRAAAPGNVTFLGMRDDIDDCYTAFDVFALPSHREGFPRAAMEAAAMALPIVATDIRGCRQVVDHGVNGLRVPPRNSRALAEAIERLANDADARRRMGDASHAKARAEFDQQRCIDITLDVYARLGAEPPRAIHHRVTLRRATVDDAPALARLHASRVRDGFLPILGERFLAILYRRIIRSARGVAYVVVDREEVVAFAAGATDVSTIYREFVVRDGFRAALAAARHALPAWRRVLETLRYPSATAALPPAEVLAVATAAGASGRGYAVQCVDALLTELARVGVKAVKVTVAAENYAALRMYGKCGFTPMSAVDVHAGTSSKVLVWRAR